MSNLVLHATDANGQTVPARAVIADVYAGRAKPEQYVLTLTDK